MSPETTSVFPDRLIHPLPKRRLRERLPPNVAESIQYPPIHVTGTPLFYYPYNLKDDVSTSIPERPTIFSSPAYSKAPTTPPARVARPDTPGAQHTRRTSDGNGSLSASSPHALRTVNRAARHPPAAFMPSHPEARPAALSAASSVDGYDSFENTNNKKKRKIPTASDTSHAGSYTSTEVHSTTSGTSNSTSNDESSIGSTPSHMHSSPASFAAVSPGISGPGRGRYGRSRNGRSPLRLLSDTGSNWAGRNGKLQSAWPTSLDSEQMSASGGNFGIISNAIANAEKASREQENAEQVKKLQASVMATPASAQFTFTCTSQVPGNNLTWPGSDPRIPAGSSNWQGRLRGGLAHPMGPGSHDKGRDGVDAADATNGSLRGSEGGDTKQAADKAAARKLERELLKQARDRKRNQQRQNAANPPTEEPYMCPFCEYETIYHKKPRSFIRSFELRERKKREQAAERQRLLDKAKARGRKGKKAASRASASGTAGGAAAAAAAAQATAGTANRGESSADNQPPGRGDGGGRDDVQTGDGYYEDDDDGGGGEEEVYRGPGVLGTRMRGASRAAENMTAHPPEFLHVPVVS